MAGLNLLGSLSYTPVDGSGQPYAGALLYVYRAGTSTAVTSYTTSALSVANTDPVVADGNGRFANVWVSDAVAYDYRVRITTSTGSQIADFDNIPRPFATQDAVGRSLYPQSAAEQSAAVTPANYYRPYGDRRRYASLANAIAVSASHPLTIYDSETVDAATALPAGADIRGVNRPLITNSTNGEPVFTATSVATVTIDGIRFKGNSASAVPGTAYGGYSGANNGLVTITTCTDVRVTNCEFDTFYNGVTVQNCDRVWVQNNRVRNYTYHGILCSASTNFHIDHNVVTDCQQSGGVVAYGISGTGDEAGGNTQQFNSISFNHIDGVPSWDGIMSHDVTGLQIIGNDIRNVRQGIDVGHLVAANEVRNVIIADNYIKSTTTNSWGGTAASIGGILVSGYDATDRVLGAVIANNVIDGFFATSMTGGGTPSQIVVSNADDVIVQGNIVKNGGSTVSNAGVRVSGTCNRLVVNGNILQGGMAQGAIRFATVTSDAVSVTGNVIKQTTSTDSAVEATGSTISAFALSGNTTNSTIPWTQSTSTITLAGEVLEGSATFNPASLADGAGETTTVTVTGAALGDFASASFGGDLSGITLTAYVSAANTVTVRFQNESGGTLDLGSSTLRARVVKRVGA